MYAPFNYLYLFEVKNVSVTSLVNFEMWQKHVFLRFLTSYFPIIAVQWDADLQSVHVSILMNQISVTLNSFNLMGCKFFNVKVGGRTRNFILCNFKTHFSLLLMIIILFFSSSIFYRIKFFHMAGERYRKHYFSCTHRNQLFVMDLSKAQNNCQNNWRSSRSQTCLYTVICLNLVTVK